VSQRPRRLEHFEVVSIGDTANTRQLEVDGATGVVVGVTEGDTPEIFYAVLLEPLGRTVMLSEMELTPTGEHEEPRSIYDGTQIRVSERGEIGD
jgi:hypothetical protein